MKKIAILGNCQIYAVQKYLSAQASFIENWEILPIPPVFQISDGHAILDMLESADCIATQPLHSLVGGCDMSQDSLRKRYNNLIIFPNVYFDGYNPELFYLKIDGALAKSPLFDYTLINILYSYINGHSILECAELWYPEINSDRSKITAISREIISESIDELTSRDSLCDILSSSFVRENFIKSRIFFTMNHPSAAVMNHVVSQLFGRLGLHEYINQSDDLFSHTLMPMISPVKNAFVFDDVELFRINTKNFTPFEVIANFYEWFSNYSISQLKNGFDARINENPLLFRLLSPLTE